MKKLFLVLAAAAMTFGPASVFAQEPAAATEAATEQVEEVAAPAVEEAAIDTEVQIAGDSMHHILMQKFLEGGWGWMLPVLLCLILGLAIAIERILYLSLSTINTKKFMLKVEEALKTAASRLPRSCAATPRVRLPRFTIRVSTATTRVLTQSRSRSFPYGSVQTGRMESGLSWIGLFIALSPMLGFMGTVVGMIGAFDAIQAAGDISPTLVAGGIKVALLTTLMGLIAAVILQLFYNYIISKIDSIVNDMEDASIILMDMLTVYKK